jgi:DNA-binding NtrC family response regulator
MKSIGESAALQGSPALAQESISCCASWAELPNLKIFNDAGHVRRLHDIHKEILVVAMRHYQGRTTHVARALGIGRSTLYRKLADFQIKWEETRLTRTDEKHGLASGALRADEVCRYGIAGRR